MFIGSHRFLFFGGGNEKMRYIADLRVRSPFSRATSKAGNLQGLAAWARVKVSSAPNQSHSAVRTSARGAAA